MTDRELFQPKQFLTPKWYLFKNSKLGQVYQGIPWDQLADCLPEENKGPGAPRWFSSQGMFGLLFLKAYLNISDERSSGLTLTRAFNYSAINCCPITKRLRIRPSSAGSGPI